MPDTPHPAAALVDSLRTIFGARLAAVVAYGERQRQAVDGRKPPPLHTLVVVDRLAADDLRACAAEAAGWRKRGLATPLLLPAGELSRALDAFPLEYAEILADHTMAFGPDPFARLQVGAADLRRACEVQTRSHLLHLREGYLETGGEPKRVAALISGSAAALGALLRNIARLEGLSRHEHDAVARHVRERLRLDTDVLHEVLKLADRPEPPGAHEATQLFPSYLDAVERLAGYVDAWRS